MDTVDHRNGGPGARGTDRTPSSSDVRGISEVGWADEPQVGGKAANLGELVRRGFPVPDGFVISAVAFTRAMDVAGASAQLQELVRGAGERDATSLSSAPAAAQAIVRAAGVPDDVVREIRVARGSMDPTELVAVRSSAVGEDSATTSFAGINESFTNVTDDALLDRVLDCWASAFSERALAYRSERGFTTTPTVAVVVQSMVHSDRSGIAFSVDPSGSAPDRLLVEAELGQGEAAVGGLVEPDTYVVDRVTRQLTSVHRGRQAFQIVGDAGGGDRRTSISEERSNRPVLGEDEVLVVADTVLRIEAAFGSPQDVEFAFDRTGELLIVQARPITAGSGTASASASSADQPSPPPTEPAAPPGAPAVTGLAASPGRASGRVRVLSDPAQQHELLDGEVLVAPMTNPDWVPTIRRAAAVVTDGGGITCHAAIVSRELGVPAVVGAHDATQVLHDGQLVTVDGSSGTVTLGGAGAPVPALPATPPPPTVAGAEPQTTATAVYVNLAFPERAAAAATLPVDGVGLLRAEFMLTTALDGEHPRRLIATGRSSEFVERMSASIGAVAEAFSPRPVVYRTTDFRTNEFRALLGGEDFEPQESNPMIGYRGCFRYLRDPDVFALELDAVAEARERTPNLHVMLPFVRTGWELEACLELIDRSPLGAQRGMRRWIMAEVPSVVYRLEDYASMGIDGVSIGSNDLTQLVLGVDRDSELCADLFDARDAAVMAAIEQIVTSARACGLTSSLCGQAPSNDPSFAESLVRFGIDSVSVDPAAAVRTRAVVAAAEQRILLDAARVGLEGSRPLDGG